MIRIQKYMVAQKVRKATRADIYRQKDILVLAALVKSLQKKLAKHAAE